MSTSKENIFRHSLHLLLSPLREYLEDDSISEVVVNGIHSVYVERGGRLHQAPIPFQPEEQLYAAIKSIAQYVGRRIDTETPRLDARLPDGSRVHIVIPPAAVQGPYMAIRKFSKSALTLRKLIEYGALSEEGAEFLNSCILAYKNIMVSGGTGTGKTSLLNALSRCCDEAERIIVIEDSAELQIQQEHVLQLETQQGDTKGRGKVSIRDLFHSAMRLRPDRVLIGEIRGEESLDVIQAMTSGHAGSLSTIHASTPGDCLRRLETLAMMSNVELPLFALRSQVSSALQVIVQVGRFKDGSRKITEIADVLPLNAAGHYQTQPIFQFRHEGTDTEGRIKGRMVYSGKRPAWIAEAVQRGLAIPECMREN